MNYRLAKEIYGQPWFIDPLSMASLTRTLDDIRSGVKYEGEKLNTFGVLNPQSNVLSEEEEGNKSTSPESIAIYNFNSVITKYGGMSHHGVVDHASFFQEMESNDNVIGHIFRIESGGGASNAIKYIRDYSAKGKRKKPLVVYAEDIMASAAMYIASDADYIFVRSEDAYVGSIGTMIEFEGYKANTEDATGKRHIRVYASQSVNKNIEFEEAINNFNFELIKSTMLDPHCNQFIADMEANRPNITPEQKTGKIFRAGECVGTLIDAIGSFQEAVDKVNELAQLSKTNINLENNMGDLTLSQADLDKRLAEAESKGRKEENSRVKAFAAYAKVDLEKSLAGINDMGAQVDTAFMAEMSLKQVELLQKQGHVDDNQEEVDASGEVKTEAEINIEESQNAMAELMSKITKKK